MNGPHFGHGTLGFGQPQVNMRGQALEQRGQHLYHARAGTGRGGRTNSGGRPATLTGCAPLSAACRASWPATMGQLSPFGGKAFFTDVERHYCIAVAGDLRTHR